MACGQVLTSCLQFGAEEIAHVMDLRLHVLQRGGPSGLHELRQWFDWMLTHGSTVASVSKLCISGA